MTAPPASRLIRVVMLSACTALIVGGLWLFFSGVKGRLGATVDLAATENEAALAQQVQAGASRLQLLAGAGLTLLGVGGLLWQRASHLRQGSDPSHAERGR